MTTVFRFMTETRQVPRALSVSHPRTYRCPVQKSSGNRAARNGQKCTCASSRGAQGPKEAKWDSDAQAAKAEMTPISSQLCAQ